MRASNVVSETFSVLTSGLWVLFPIAFAGTAMLEIITALFFARPIGDGTAVTTPEEMLGAMFSAQGLFSQLPALFIGTYVNLLVVRISWALLTGEPLDVNTWARQMIPLTIPGVMVTFSALFLILAGVALFIIPGLILTALLMVILPVLVIEGVTGPVSAMLRSRELMQEHLFTMIGLVLLLILAAFGVLTIVTPILMLADSLSAGLLVSAAIGSILTIFSAALPTVIYRQVIQQG
ncbi:hypothetical protein [Pontivivens insulae]|uniref:Glycerophosphoryl diester phosphodiesterase membrane domain-containing protein n=1 Tax=Pontivivens insulae TaxID=1639689 RepID=A0A2R8ABP9_9RHOB|nr:hypothetical protein [Pontivivens insulae]RED11153.1 hypothetical protein DFR53_3183 [Pontivivens insulae]SPF29673.1 hypothetical protein POI8812_01989 [Pontivivens insulae]